VHPQAGKCTPRQSKKSRSQILEHWRAVEIWSTEAINLMVLALIVVVAASVEVVVIMVLLLVLQLILVVVAVHYSHVATTKSFASN